MKKKYLKIRLIFWIPAVSLAFLIAGALILFQFDRKPAERIEIKTGHITTPETVKAIYLTAYSAGSKRFDELLKFAEKTEINSFVIDIKTGSGYLSFEPKNQNLKNFADTNIQIPDFDGIIKKAHDKNIYLIARVFVFQDPALVAKNPQWAVQNKYGGLWKDWRGATWLDPAVQGVWDYNVALGREAYERGFDEINFDYIRFPSDGPVSAMKFNYWKGGKKSETMKSFYEYLDKNLRASGIPISADLFGLTCCNDNDLTIGQRLVDAYPYFNAIGQMMYPSHYYGGFRQYTNPAEFPYEVVKMSLDETMVRLEHFRKAHPEIPEKNLAKIRPWLQDFDMGANYDAAKIRGQIKAVADAGADGWMFWNARNVYTEDGFANE
jgi:hypothetical protein